ncbi:MBL fold metallo-hydrolase [Peredibacter sp. HCB2-198]|uniref:MBL fold metallo-hydrolase n=1 Tax=Peredibacter sp. HCB2-198 TaxID=3383025 RepID=UPI0038B43BCB
MRIHHLNCISSCPLGGRLMDDGVESVLHRGHLTNHCLLIETSESLVLIDTGFGLNDVKDPSSRLSHFFLNLVKPEFREEMTAFRQIERMGLDPKDVKHIILTHLDFDHAGGLDDFPWAKVHLLEAEREYAFLQKTWLDRQRFRPEQWNTKNNWIGYEPTDGEGWFGFNLVRKLQGLPPEILLVPLIGHTFGHAGVAIKAHEGWYFLTGDAYFFHEEMHPAEPRCTPGLAFYQRMMDKNHKLRVWNQQRLRELKRDHSDKIEIFCSHDVEEFERLTGRTAQIPIEKMTWTGSMNFPYDEMG